MKSRLATILLILLIFSGCTPRLYEIKQTEELMGTFVTITIYDSSKEKAAYAINSAFEEIQRIENLLSNYKNDSEISLLNKNKEILDFSEDLLLNIEKSVYYSELSDGAFDITVQPILDLYTKSFTETKAPPSDEQVKETLTQIDYRKIQIRENKISIKNNQKITLGGLAKGYAVDKAVEILKNKGIEHALVNAGGDMRALGKKYGSVNWNIALANPRDKKEYITTTNLADKAIVTSGDYERYFDPDMKFHHIVDPRTGYSATDLISVTILTDDTFDADAISTSVFVLGPEKGLKLVESLDNVEGLLITKERKIIKSSGFD
jgi:FAD:protein FMN transferase